MEHKEKELKYYPELAGASWGRFKKKMKEIDKMSIDSVVGLKEQIERYSEIYTVVEDSTLLVGADYLRFGNFKSLSKAAWQLLRCALPGLLNYNKRKKRISVSPYFEELVLEEPKLKLLLEKDEKFPLQPLMMLREYYHVLKFSGDYGRMQIDFNGKKLSYYKLQKYLEDPDRSVRFSAWSAQNKLLSERSSKYNKIFDKLLKIRIQRAKKCGYDNVRDYFHDSKGRFDYRPEDCLKFHDAIEKTVVPIVAKLNDMRREKLGVDSLRPWDKMVPIMGPPLKPYSTEEELLEKVNRIYEKIDPEFAAVFRYMREKGFIDSENRKGKTPGGMSIPLMMHRCGFIITNNVGTSYDVSTMIHEGGHAVQYNYMSELPFAMYREFMNLPMELAEIGSMTMEMLALDYLDEIYPDPKDRKRAISGCLLDPIRFLPWCATVDAFQQWIYTNLDHTVEQRMEKFGELVERFDGAAGIDYSGIEKERNQYWFKQTHIFQMPFYYIEYGIAQLAAIAIYRNYKQNKARGVEQFKALLGLGYSKSLPEIFKAGGIRFDFSESYLKELVEFIRSELKTLDFIEI